MEQVKLELRELAGAVKAVGVDEIGNADLGVALLLGVEIQHELPESAVEARNVALHEDEAGAGDLARGVKVKSADGLAERDVILHLEIELPRLAPVALLDVEAVVLSYGNGIIRKVRDGVGDLADLGKDLVLLLLDLVELLADLGNLCHDGGGILAVSLRLPDLLREGVALGLQLLGPRLE